MSPDKPAMSAPLPPECGSALASLIQLELEARIALNLSQTQLAQRMHTTQSVISCFERGQYNPTLHFLERMAKALDKKLLVSFEPSVLSDVPSPTAEASS